MSPATYQWLRAGHFIGLFVWLGGMFAVYWLMRFHAHAPKDAHEKLLLSERALAMMMDLGATLAMGCGLAIAFGVSPNLFARPGGGWFHVKLTVVVLGLLPVHGMLRAKLKKFSQGNVTPVPAWMWSALLASITAIVLLIEQGPRWFAR